MARNKPAMIPIGGEQPKPLKKVPFPGLLDGHKWKIREGRWPVFIDRSDLEGEGGIMQVPLEDSPVGRKLRLHEQAHVEWTPHDYEVSGVEDATIEACEDGRIIHLMNQTPDWENVNKGTAVIPAAVIARHAEDFNRLARKMQGEDETVAFAGAFPTPTIPLIQAGRLLAMTRGYHEEAQFDQIAYQNSLDWLVQPVNELHEKHIASKHRPTFEDTVAYARELEELLNEMEESLMQANQDLADADMDQRISEPPDQRKEEFEWGDMTIETAPLTQKLRGDPSRKQRPVDMGAVPRYMHRLLSDQRVFGRRRKHVTYQGTLLIDHSGSMHLSAEEVDEILARWPAVTIATYCGSGSGWGKMRIVAKGGKRAEQRWLSRPSGGANEIDGPALDWLKKQKAPRLWVSDGHVSGKCENFHPWFAADAARKVRQGRIKRIDGIHQILGT